MAWATTQQVETWLDGPAPDGLDRLIARAEGILKRWIKVQYDDTDTDTAAVLANAVCAQIEFWMEMGEAHDVIGAGGKPYGGGAGGITLPGRIAPRARDELLVGGLGYQAATTATSGTSLNPKDWKP